MLQEEDATSEIELGDDEEDILSPRQISEPNTTKIPPLILSVSSDAILTKTSISPLSSSSGTPRRPSLTSSPSDSPSPSPRGVDGLHRNRNQTQPANPQAQAPPKMVSRSQTESQLTLPRKPTQDLPSVAPASSSAPSLSSPPAPLVPSLPSLSSPTSSPSLTSVRQSTPASKLKEFAENPDVQPLSRFEARMAILKGPPKYPSLRQNRGKQGIRVYQSI